MTLIKILILSPGRDLATRNRLDILRIKELPLQYLHIRYRPYTFQSFSASPGCILGTLLDECLQHETNRSQILSFPSLF